MIFGYARVSTRGQSLSEQISQLRSLDIKRKNIFSEKITGTTLKRPMLNKLLKLLKPDDTLVVTKLDRLARKTDEAINIIDDLLSHRITIKILGLGTIEDTPIGRMIVRTIASVAEMERDLIVERSEEGRRYARQHKPGYQEGRPTRLHSKKKEKYEAIYNFYKNHSASITADSFDVSVRTVYYVNSLFKTTNKQIS